MGFIWDMIKQLFIYLYNVISSVLSYIGEAIQKVSVFFTRQLEKAFEWIYTEVYSFIFSGSVEGVDPADIQASFDAIWDHVESISYFFPIGYIMTTLSFTVATIATIRAARWLKSFIPLIGD